MFMNLHEKDRKISQGTGTLKIFIGVVLERKQHKIKKPVSLLEEYE